MTLKSYSKTVSKERLATYTRAYLHFNLLRNPKTEPSESAGSVFSVSKPKTSPVYLYKNSLPDQDFSITEETEEFIDQCLHEYITWLAETELKHAKTRLSLIEPFKPTDFSPLQHKEDTTQHG